MAAQHPKLASDSLEKIPDNIAVSFLPNFESLSKRALEKGLNYFTQGYIHDIKISEAHGTMRVDARCWRSMRKSQDPHNLHVEIGDDKLSESYCTCKVGMGGHCSHIVGLLKSLQGLKLHNFTHVPDQQSCTSIPQQWHIPRGNKIQPVPVNHVVVARPLEGRKRRPILCQVDTEEKLPRTSPEDVKVLKDLDGTPLQYILSTETPTVSTPLGKVQIGSFLSYQTRNLRKPSPPESSIGCGDTSIFKPSPVTLPQEYKDLNIGYDCDVQKLEITTRQQANTKQWYEARKNRLTASNFGKVINRKSAPSVKFLNNLFKIKNIYAPSLDYGKRHESVAKGKYLEKNRENHFHECGFVVNKSFSFLGATPDGKLCDHGKSGIVEIKCPFSARNMKVDVACVEIRDFFMETVNGMVQLKTGHDYYAQVQGQLMITGAEFCEFIVYTQCDMVVERIKPDIPFMTEMFEKLSIFFKDFAKPFFISTSTE